MLLKMALNTISLTQYAMKSGFAALEGMSLRNGGFKEGIYNFISIYQIFVV
jgi:hypothetical protein